MTNSLIKRFLPLGVDAVVGIGLTLDASLSPGDYGVAVMVVQRGEHSDLLLIDRDGQARHEVAFKRRGD